MWLKSRLVKNSLDESSSLLGFEVFVERVLVSPVDIDLAEEVKGHIELVLSKLLDLLLSLGFLAAKLVARECQDT